MKLHTIIYKVLSEKGEKLLETLVLATKYYKGMHFLFPRINKSKKILEEVFQVTCS